MAGEDISNAFSRLLSRNNLYLLGSLEVVPAKWGFISINVVSLSNFQLHDVSKGLVSLKLSIVQQRDRNKRVVADFQTDFLPIKQTINFSDRSAFAERLIIDEPHQMYNLHIAVLVHYSSQSIVLCQKRYNLTDMLETTLESNEDVKLQIKPEESAGLKTIAELRLSFSRTFIARNTSTKKISPSENKIDVVDFRNKRDAELIEILLMSHL